MELECALGFLRCAVAVSVVETKEVFVVIMAE